MVIEVFSSLVIKADAWSEASLWLGVSASAVVAHDRARTRWVTDDAGPPLC